MTTLQSQTPARQEALAMWSRVQRPPALAPLREAFRTVVADRFALAGVIVIGLFVVVGVTGQWLTPTDPFATATNPDGSLAVLEPPSAQHWLGTTAYAKDVLAQLLVGTRVAIIVGVSAAVAVGIVSTLLGLLSGYFRGVVDETIMRLTDLAMSIPTLPIGIVAVAILGPGLRNIILVIAALFWRNGARIVRSVVLTEKEKVYVQAARAAGAPHRHIILTHILPNVLPVAFLWMTMSVALAVLMEASLSFLGLGDPDVISWGQMLNTAFTSGVLRTTWWWVLPPSACLMLLVASLYLVGRAYEEQASPRLRRASRG